MMAMGAIGRRRFMRIAAAVAGAGLATGRATARSPQVVSWQGTALGADASILLSHNDRDRAQSLIDSALAEIERLEQVFSLYRSNSAISRLNRQGYLDRPPQDLVRLLSEAWQYSNLTEGAFDITVQPLWQLYARHFHEGESADGPDEAEVRAALARIDYKSVTVNPARITFEKTGMAATLNGIAQGYVTDRIAELLRRGGLNNVLVDLGELRALGRHPDGRLWTVDLSDSPRSTGAPLTFELNNTALATSAGFGTTFDGQGRFHHLLDPRSGESSNRYLSLSVRAANATQADALSTGLFHLGQEQLGAIVRQSPGLEAIALLDNGERRVWRS